MWIRWWRRFWSRYWGWLSEIDCTDLAGLEVDLSLFHNRFAVVRPLRLDGVMVGLARFEAAGRRQLADGAGLNRFVIVDPDLGAGGSADLQPGRVRTGALGG